MTELSDTALLARADRLAKTLREGTVELVCLIDVIELKDLHLKHGYSSIFDLCVKRWRLSRDAAARHVKAARAVRLVPEVAVWLRSGELSLSAAAQIQPYLKQHGRSLARRALGKDLPEIDALIAEIAPAPAAPDRVRVVAVQAASPVLAAATAARDATHAPAAAAPDTPVPDPDLFSGPVEVRVLFEFQAGPELRAMVDRARDLLFHRFPRGELRDICGEAVRRLLEDIDPAMKAPAKPRPAREEPTRRIPQWVQDVVRHRDGDRCAYVAEDGTRCCSTRGLESDHIRPWADGGPSDDPDNVRQVCPPHNRWLAKERFGDRAQRGFSA